MNNIRPTRLVSRLTAFLSGICLLVSTTIGPSWAEDAASSNPPSADSGSASTAGSGNNSNGNVDVTDHMVDTAILINGDNANLLHELQILSGQNVFIDFGSIQGGSLSLSGDISNSGNIYAFSTNSTVQAGTLGANSITNTGLISTASLPLHLLCGLNIDAASLVANFGLNLAAATAIVNSGSIVSSGAVSMVAPQIINSGTVSAATDIAMQAASIVNSGTIAAQLGAITALTSSITNTGVLQAMQGSINIQNIIGNSLLVDNSLGSILAQDTVLFETLGTLVDINGDILSKAGLNVTGGSIAADVIKFVSPDGIIDVVADHLNGNVSISGGDAYVSALSGDLNLVHMELSGDPIFSAAGNLNLTGLFSQGSVFNTNGGDFVALAGGNIFSDTAGTIDTSGVLGYGRIDIQAGVLYRVNGSLLSGNPVKTGVQFPGGFNCADCSSRYEVLGANALLGGNIQLGNVNFVTDGQSFNARAYAGLVNSGNISLGSVDTSGQTAGRSGGSITIAAPGAVSLNAMAANGADGSFASSSGIGGAGGTIDVRSTLSTVNIAGIVSSIGGKGADAAVLDGGNGGDGNSIYISALGNVDFLSDILSQGGDGGNGKRGTGAGAGGGNGGDAGRASSITIESALGSITGSVSSLIASSGGNGGRGANGKDSPVGAGGSGGNGGLGGDGGNISLGGTGLINAIITGTIQSSGGNGGRGGNGGNGVDAILFGGIFGAGGEGGQGANGGNAGTIQVGSLGAVNLAAVINTSGNGGKGGNGGDAGSYMGAFVPAIDGAAGGKGGDAGFSGNVSISSALSQLNIGSVQLQGGNGGNGGGGGNAAYDSLGIMSASMPGGVGGNGGSGADAATLAMNFLLAGYFDNISVIGGNGGNGGLGGSDGFTSRADEGFGGSAGNAHGLNIAGNTILTVNNVSVFGGRGGNGLIGAAGGNAGSVELSALIDLTSSGAILVKGGRGGDSLNTGWMDITSTVDIDGYQYYSSSHIPLGYTGGQAGSAGDISLGALRDLTVGDVSSTGGRGGNGFNGAEGGSGGNLSLSAGRSVTSYGNLISQGGRGGDGRVYSDAALVSTITSPASTVIDGAYTYTSLNVQQYYYSGHVGGDGGRGGNSGTVAVNSIGAININNVTAAGGRGGDGFNGGDGGDALLTSIQSALASVSLSGSIVLRGGNGGNAIDDVGRIYYADYSSNSVNRSGWLSSSFSGAGITQGFEISIDRTGGRGGNAVALEIAAPISVVTDVIALQGGNGGYGPIGGAGGDAGDVSLSSFGIVQVNSSLSANGGKGGDAVAPLEVVVSSVNGSSSFTLLGITGSEYLGDYNVQYFSANRQAGNGGNGGNIVINVAGMANLADIAANGGNGGNGQNGNAGGNGGFGGSISIEDPLLLTILGNISANGGNGGSSRAVIASDFISSSSGSYIDLPLSAFSQEQSSAVTNVLHQVASSGGQGGNGGGVSINAANLEQLSSLSINANGGRGGNGAVAGNGGDGGNIDVHAHGLGALLNGALSAHGGNGGRGIELSDQTSFYSSFLSIDNALILATIQSSSASETYSGRQFTYGGNGGAGGNVNLSSNGILSVFAASADGGDGGRGSAGGNGGDGGNLNLSSSGLMWADSLSASGGNGGNGSTYRTNYESVEQNSNYISTFLGDIGVDTVKEVRSRTFTGGDGGRGGNGGFISVGSGIGSVVLSISTNGGAGGNGYSGGNGGNGGIVEIQPGILGFQSEYVSAVGGNGGNGKVGNSVTREKTAIRNYGLLSDNTERSRARTEEQEGGNGGRGGNGGNVSVVTLGLLDLGTINVSGGNGGNGAAGGRGGSAGDINLLSFLGSTTISNGLVATGGNGGNGILADGGRGGRGGQVLVLSLNDVSLNKVDLNGGRGGNGFVECGNGGDAGSIYALSGRNLLLSDVSLNGGRGGNGFVEGGNGGDAGSIYALSGRNLLLSDVSLNGGRGGNGFVEGGNGGGAGSIYALSGRNLLLSDVSLNGGRGGNGFVEGGNGGDGGNILALARNVSFAGSLTVNGGNGGYSYDEGGNGGDAGNIALVARRNIVSSGYASVEATGGRRGNSEGDGGNGGDIAFVSRNGSINARRTVIAANGYGDGNSAGNIIMMAENGNIRLGGLTAVGRQGADGGNILLQANNVRVGCLGCPSISIDVSAFGGGDAGRILITTDSDNPFTVGGNTSANGTRGNIAANGRSGGRIDLLNGGGQIVNSGYSITANGRSGEGGRILFSTDDPGSKVLNTTINGLVEATNNAGNSGRIGFHSGPALNLNISGTGVARAGEWVAIGNLKLGSLDLATANAGILAPYPIQLTIIGELRCNAINCYSSPVASAVVVGLSESIDTNQEDKSTPEEVELPKFANVFFPSDLVKRSIPLGNEKNRGPRLLAENPNSEDAKFWVVNHDPSEPFGIQGDEKLTVAAGAGTSFALIGDHTMELKTGELTVVTGDTGLDIQTSMGLVSVPPNSIAFISQSHFGKVEVATLAGGAAQILTAQDSQSGEDNRINVATGQYATLVDMKVAQSGASDIGDDFKQIAPGVGLSIASQNSDLALGMLKALDQSALTGAMLHNFNQNLGSMAAGQNSNSGPQASLPEQEAESKNAPVAYQQSLNSKYFVPVALKQSNSVSSSDNVTPAFKLVRRDTASAVVRSFEEAKINVSGAGDIELLSGEVIVAANKAMKVTAGSVSLDLIKGAMVYVSLEGKVAKIRTLSERGFKTITAQVGRHFVSLPSGYELMAGGSDSEIFANMRKDLVGRRRTHHVDLAKQNLAVSTSEYSLSSLLQNSELMRHMYVSEDKLDKQVCGEVLKMAACLHQVTASHGNYQQVALSGKRGL